MEGIAWMVCGWLLTLGFRPICHRVRMISRSYVGYGLLCLFLSVLGAAVWYTTCEALIRLCYYAARQSASLWPIFSAAASSDAKYPWLIQYGYLLFFSNFPFMWCSLYFGINAMLDLETERANVLQALKLADSARLRSLQSNLNPHFLFNTLNGIATLVRDKDGVGASAMIDALSEFLRSTLQRLNSPEIQVSEELQLIEQYLLIQRLRFGDRLQYSVKVDPGTLGALVPTLILQPLVENAVLHGVLPREEGGSVQVSVGKLGEMLMVSVEDDGVGIDSAIGHADGLGLGNSRDRLAALYGESAQLTAGPRAGGNGFAVMIRLPYRHSQELRQLLEAEAQLV
jgi:two-component system LytT family sensor kinase